MQKKTKHVAFDFTVALRDCHFVSECGHELMPCAARSAVRPFSASIAISFRGGGEMRIR